MKYTNYSEVFGDSLPFSHLPKSEGKKVKETRKGTKYKEEVIFWKNSG